jgi:hypothetical protein
MRITIILISTFLSWAVYDTNLFRRRQQSVAAIAAEVLPDEEDAREQKEIQHREIIPPWYRKKKLQIRQRCNYFSVRPRDVRYSDQQKIRRRINNM